MRQDLFNGEYVPVVTTLELIRQYGFESFESNKNTVSLDYASTIDKYDDYGEIPFYHLYPSYNTATGNSEYRFLVIVIDNRKWMYMYKVVRILATKQIRFFGLPTTDGVYVSSDIERMVRVLAEHPFVRFVFNDGQRERITRILDGFRECRRLVNHDEFFYTISDDDADFTSNRWRKKHYVNLFENSDAFGSQLTHCVGVAETMELRELWARGMAAKGDTVRVSTERSFQRFIRNADGDTLRVISLRHDGRLVAQEMFLLDGRRRICQSLFCIHIFDYGDDILLKHVVNRMVAIQKYLSWKYLRYVADAVYVGTGANRKLYSHKERTCDGKVEYFIM